MARLTFLALVSYLTYASCTTQSPPLMVKQPPTDELLFQVASRIDENDKPFIIECEAEGEPAPKYKWFKNGHEFLYQTEDYRISQQPGRGTLVITQPKDVDIGQYQCFATNEFGTAASNSVFVRKSELSNFKEEPPKSISEQEGKPFSLKCQPPDGWPKPSVYWMIQSNNGALRSVNSSRMTVDPEGTLWFSNVTRDDSSEDFVYACSATSKFRNEYKLGNRVYLDVVPTGSSASQNRHEPMQQYVSRKNMVGYRGERVEMWCVFGGTPLPQIKWSKTRGTLASSRVDYTNYGKTLVIKSVDFEDEGSYECEASNGVGSPKSYSINLEVQAKPYFTVEPEVVRAAEDDTAVFRCEASGKPTPEIQWIHNGKKIESYPENTRRKIRKNEIVIEKLTKLDTGNYGCNATNSLGYVYKDVYLNVLALPPEMVEAPSDVATVDGSSVNMTCKVTGAPKPRVKWVRDGLELTGGRYKVMDDGNLEIRDVTFTDAGAYSCFAQNKFGSIDAVGNLVVKERTRIMDGPEDYEVAAGSTATFRCTAVSDSSLKLKIDWMSENETIDFEQEPRFVQSQDFSLTITKTTELDTGEYTCVARTELDSATAKASLIVQDVPNAPKLVGVQCNPRDAVLEWIPQGDNRSPIILYTVQHNTSFTPDSWEVSFESVPATDRKFTVPMSPWSNYTFRVIARNKIGPSLPSEHSDVCSTPPDVPYRNPDGVEGRGTAPDNLEIRWTPMSEIEHNAPKFRYRVFWRPDVVGSPVNIEEITDWRQSSVVIPNQPTFKKYRIKVVALNERGDANVAAQEVIGYSGEDRPLEAPSNFTLKEIIDAKSALLSWNPVNPENVRGHFKGYQIETWTNKETEAQAREVIVSKESTVALVHKFVPHALNYVRVRVINSAFKGPPSEVLSFNTPEGRPGAVDMLEAIPMGSSAFYLIWKAPEEPNGVLTGYRLFYQKVEGTKVGPLQEREPPITDPTQTRAKLAGLEPGTKYRIEIRATTAAGDGEKYFIERTTQTQQFIAPDKPRFTWYQVSTDSGFPAVRIMWHPNVDGRPGSHFYAQYRRKGEPMFESTPNEFYEDYIVVRGLDETETYEMRIVAVDGDHTTASDVQEIALHPTDRPYVHYKENVATAGWFIGMLLAVAFLLIVLILVCIIKRNRGGKYAVHEREALQGRHDFQEEAGGFPEYSQAAGRVPKSSISSDFRMPHESDTDSMAEYGDGDAGEFAEDGSFIGQYRPSRKEVAPSPPEPGTLV